MSVNNKTIGVLIIFIILLIIITATFSQLKPDINKNSEYYAKQFLEVFTTPENGELATYYNEIFTSESKTIKEVEEDFNKYVDMVKNEYEDLMTDDGYNKAVSNRFLPWDILIEENDNYKVKIKSIELKQVNIYEGGRAHYSYLLSLDISPNKGKKQSTSVSGDIIMIEKNGTWLVDIFKWNSDFQDIYKLITM